MENKEKNLVEQGKDNPSNKTTRRQSQEVFEQDQIAKGSFQNKYYTGVGRYYWDGGHMYEGQFKNGQLDGFGELVWNVELNLTEKYEGIFKEGAMSQVGTFTWADGTQYSGYWQNGKPDKVGVLRTKDSIKQKQSNGSDVFGIISKLIINEENTQQQQNNSQRKISQLPNNDSTGDQLDSSEQKNDINNSSEEQSQKAIPQQILSPLQSQRQSISSQGADTNKFIVQKNMLQPDQLLPERATQPKHLQCSPQEVLICKSIGGKIYKLYPLPQLLIDSILNTFKPPETDSSEDDGESLKNFVDERTMKNYLQQGIQQLVGQDDDLKGSKLKRQMQIKDDSITGGRVDDIFSEEVNELQNHYKTEDDPILHKLELDNQFEQRPITESTQFVQEDKPIYTQFEGLDTSGQKLVVTITAYFPKTFSTIREQVKISTKHFVESICSETLQEKKSTGKSGSIFLISENKQFFLKTINNVERDVLVSSLDRYLDHLNLHQNSSLLCKYLGLFHVNLQSKYNLMKSKQVNIIVMESVFKMSYQIDRRYDLKGSSKKRTCGKENFHKENIELKDLDLDMRMVLAPNMYKRVTGQINYDVTFLESLKVMDYSLIIGVHRPYKNMMRQQQNQSTLSKLMSTNSFSLGRWVDPQKFVQNLQLSAQPIRNPNMIEEGKESFMDRKNNTQSNNNENTAQQFEADDNSKSRVSVSNIWGNFKSNLKPIQQLNPRAIINKISEEQRQHRAQSQKLNEKQIDTQMPINIDSQQNIEYDSQYPNEKVAHRKIDDMYFENQEGGGTRSTISSEFGSSQQQKKLMISSDQANYKDLDRHESNQSSGSLEKRVLYKTSQSESNKEEREHGSYNSKKEGKIGGSGRGKHSNLRPDKLREHANQNSWNRQVSPESMVDQIQKLISSGSVFQRINSHIDPNLRGQSSYNSSNESQTMASEMQFITDQINELIMHKLADYNRLLNSGGGGQDHIKAGESSLENKNKKEKNSFYSSTLNNNSINNSNGNLQSFSLDLPSDKKDDVIKITMLLVALVVYKLEARETQQKEILKQQEQKKRGTRVLHRDFTLGKKANEGQLKTYTNAEWFKKETEGKALGIELHCVANPQKPREHSSSAYENGPEQVIVCMGIIDYLVEFNWYKYMEYSMKIAMYGVSGAKGVSVQPPDIYSQRFLKFMKSSLFEKVA